MSQHLQKRIHELEAEIERLKDSHAQLEKRLNSSRGKPTVKVPKHFSNVFTKAEKNVGDYFKSIIFTPSEGTIDINNDRYVLVRASALSHEFLNSIKNLYSDRGEEEATQIGRNILFDIAHVIGTEDANTLHRKMKLRDPISKLSAGPVHFAYTGWAFVDILPESNPSPDEHFYLKYHHPFSFEADAWIKAGKRSDLPVCVMSAGYSSGWCEASFEMPLTAVEITCRARGDKHCTFIMAPPDKIDQYIKPSKRAPLSVPSFLERKKIEEKLKESLREKEVLIKEIHHRVKNNLQIVSSLLNLQIDSIQDAKTREKFTESIGRVKSMAIIHELLYRSRNLSSIRIRDYITELVSFIKETYVVNKHIRVYLTVDIHDEFIEIDKAIPCGIIINELLSNAYKYAFPGQKKGSIRISFKSIVKKEVTQYRLSVTDNGVGISGTGDLKSAQTLGLQLVHSLVDQLDGQLSVQRKNGTAFLVKFS